MSWSATRRLLAVAAALAAAGSGAVAKGVTAQGHGPIYGLSTPTLGQDGWSLDVGAMGRVVADEGGLMVRPMLSYGVTEDVQAYGSVPIPVVRADRDVPPMRAFARMPATRDVEVGIGWRFQRRGLGVGARQETTVWAAVVQPVEDARAGVPTSPGGFAAVVTGYASRVAYVWAGGAYRRYVGRSESRPGDVAMASLVAGYRPAAFRKDYPHADWRGFLELVGEWAGRDRLAGRVVPATGGRQVFLALTVLGLYGSWGIAGGPGIPLVRNMNGSAPRERARLAVNLTFWW